MDKYLKNKKIRGILGEIEPQEVLLDSLAQKRRDEGFEERKFEVPLSQKILQRFLIFTFLLFFILFLRTFQFQVLGKEKFLALAESNKFVIAKIQAERGVIYDRFGNQLVWNKPSFDLVLDIKELPQSKAEKEKILKEVAEILDEDLEKIQEKIKKASQSELLISENLSHQTLILLESKIVSDRLPGFKIKQNPIRYYKEGPTFAHVIGYIGKIKAEEWESDPENYSLHDWVGRDGLEKAYEKVLRKIPGKIRVERDALGKIISKEIVSLPKSGKSLILWLDSKLQEKIKESLEKILKATGTKKATAVAIDPKTGGILALISLPSFDNNLFNKGTDPEVLEKILTDPLHPLFDRAISGQYPVGSTIKPLIAAAVLEEKIISPYKKINCQGKITIPHKYQPEIVYEYKDWKIHGPTDLKKAIAESCNVYFYTVGGGYKDQPGLGPTRIKRYLELFGWGQKTKIDLPGEAEGFIPDPEWKESYFENPVDKIWRDGDTYNLSIGQGYISISPLQVALAFSAIANGGTLYKPQIVQKIIEGSIDSPHIIEEFKPEIIRQNFIDSKNLQIVREGMRQAVTGENSPHASAVILNSLPVPVAAKTGTAQVKGGFHNWVTVFAPYENPQIVLTVMIEDVKELQAVALPVAKEVLEWYFSK
jgi:penicillin-binding protein 2